MVCMELFMKASPDRAPEVGRLLPTSSANRRGAWHRLLCCSVALMAVGVSGAQSFAQDQQAPQLTLTDQLELARLVDMAAQRLKVNIEYDAALLKGTVTLRLGAGVTDAELWELTNRLLATRGFTT